jgi:hypothetical protein
MTGTITFKWNDQPHITTTVKEEFVKVCPNYQTTKGIDLIKEFHIMKYFHNPSGPAVVETKNNQISYFLDGEMIGTEGFQAENLKPEKLAKLKHDEQFASKMEDLLKDE